MQDLRSDPEGAGSPQQVTFDAILPGALPNWDVAFIGNFIGAFATAALMSYTTRYPFGGGSVGSRP
jgi:formate/nitrite transporter FocA (FNT family)